MTDLLKGVILDIETTGLSLDSKIHQVAYLDMKSDEATELLITGNDWGDVLRKQYNLGPELSGPLSGDELLRLKSAAPGIYDMVVSKMQPAFSQNAPTILEMNAQIKDLGHQTRITSSVEVSLKKALDLIRGFDDRVIWIQNAAFEAKMLGQAGLGKKLYVTGGEVNAARKSARRSGDWRGVWEGYQKYTKPGDVRDIMDVLRAHHSYAKSLGITNLERPQSLSMEVVYRLQQNLLQGETHRAVLDVAIHEASVLRTAVEEIQQMQRGERPESVRQYYQRQEVLKPELQRDSVVKRLLRAQQDIDETGTSRQFSYTETTRSGRTRPVHQTFTTTKGVARFISPRYPEVDPMRILEEISTQVDPHAVQSARLITAIEEIPILPPKKSLKGFGALAVAAVAVSSILNAAPYRQPTEQNSTYEYWKENQKKFYGLNNKGIVERQRKQNTDFGSPYQGIQGSQKVLDQIWESREEANNRFKNLQRGIFDFFRGGFVKQDSNLEVPGAVKGSDGYYWADITNAKLLVQDADTLTINGSINIRFVGIDSPEIAHEDRAGQPAAYDSKRVLQEILDNASDIKVKFDPTDITYGRLVGAIYADGKNVNTELLRRGAAAALPFYNGKEPMIAHSSVLKYEERAYEADLGMWREPFFKMYRRMAELSGQRMTFNQLANPAKVAKDRDIARSVKLMNAAQQEGRITGRTALQLERIFIDKDSMARMQRSAVSKMFRNPNNRVY